jgi:hypothetical protein
LERQTIPRRRSVLPPFGFLSALRVGGVLERRDAVEARRFASIRTWEYRDSMARETPQANFTLRQFAVSRPMMRLA